MIMRALKTIWARWKVLGRRVGDFQARVLLSLFYLVVVGPFAVVVKIFSDPLALRPSPTCWLERPHGDADPLTQAKRQS